MRGPGTPDVRRAARSRGEGVLARLRRSRRGAVAVGFGVTVVGFLGLAGIATEAGYWYSAHRKGQNAADASAIAAATEGDKGVSLTGAQNAGMAVAQRNGFTSGLCSYTGSVRVCINRLTTGAYSTASPGYEAIVDQVQNVTFARIFGITSKTVSSRAVATIQQSGPACVLTLTETLNITGNFTANASDCMFASNKKGQDSIAIGGSSTVNVQSLHASGECDGCAGGNVTPGTPYTEYGRDTTNPFAALDSVSWPAFNGAGGCLSYPANGTTLQPYESNGNKAYCSNLHLPNASSGYILVPGTYVFYNSDVTINNGYLRCPTCNAATGQGVSIVLLGAGNNVGDFEVNANADVQLNAGTNTTALDPGLAGVLVYREDAQNDIGGGNPEVRINGGANVRLEGGVYYPRADGRYNGNSTSSCTIIVGGGMLMNGTATFSTAGCAAMGTGTPRVRSVALVE